MGKYKKLKMLGEMEAEHLQRQINSLNYRVNELMEEREAKTRTNHPSNGEKSWYADHVAMMERVSPVKVKLPDVIEAPKVKFVTFKRARNPHQHNWLVVTHDELRGLRSLGIPYAMVSRITGHGVLVGTIELLTYATTANISELTKDINQLFSGRFTFYAEAKDA